MIRRPSKHAMAIRNTLGVDRISSDRRASLLQGWAKVRFPGSVNMK